jgi:D-alanyl-D-alanine carboxypeptidase/D-alanyl-D-alanine-endopeptidase (penicillin-binding protein 4)
LLAVLHGHPNGRLFKESLPLSGVDGTLGGRLHDYANRISAKTGYLTYDTALSGYLSTSQGEIFAFSILCNDETGKGSSGRLIDQIVSLLAAYPEINIEKGP